MLWATLNAVTAGEIPRGDVYYIHATKSGRYRYTTDKAFAKKTKHGVAKNASESGT